MLDMGFKPQVDQILRRVSDNRQTMFFSATLDGAVGELARAYTNQPVRIEAELPSERKPGEIDHQFVSVTPETKVDTLVELLREADGLSPWCSSARSAAPIGWPRASRASRPDALAMHGDLSQVQREKALSRFESGEGHDADRHGRRSPRARPRRRQARRELRPARGREGLHPSRRPHRPRRPLRRCRHARPPRPAGRRQPRRPAQRSGRAVRRTTCMKVAAPRLVYSSRSRNSKRGPVATSPQDLSLGNASRLSASIRAKALYSPQPRASRQH